MSCDLCELGDERGRLPAHSFPRYPASLVNPPFNVGVTEVDVSMLGTGFGGASGTPIGRRIMRAIDAQSS